MTLTSTYCGLLSSPTPSGPSGLLCYGLTYYLHSEIYVLSCFHGEIAPLVGNAHGSTSSGFYLFLKMLQYILFSAF